MTLKEKFKRKNAIINTRHPCTQLIDGKKKLILCLVTFCGLARSYNTDIVIYRKTEKKLDDIFWKFSKIST